VSGSTVAVPNLAETRFQSRSGFGSTRGPMANPTHWEGMTQARGANNIRRVSSRSTTVAMTAKDAHATLEVSVPPETSLIEIDIPNRSFRSLPQHVRGTAQIP
jgi:hypothetical protein